MTPPGCWGPGSWAVVVLFHEMQSKSGFKFEEASGLIKRFEVISEVYL
jgi:hypothetical protein